MPRRTGCTRASLLRESASWDPTTRTPALLAQPRLQSQTAGGLVATAARQIREGKTAIRDGRYEHAVGLARAVLGLPGRRSLGG